jgi:hypothetical protein
MRASISEVITTPSVSFRYIPTINYLLIPDTINCPIVIFFYVYWRSFEGHEILGNGIIFFCDFFAEIFLQLFKKTADNVETSHSTFIYRLEFNLTIPNVVNIPR